MIFALSRDHAIMCCDWGGCAASIAVHRNGRETYPILLSLDELAVSYGWMLFGIGSDRDLNGGALCEIHAGRYAELGGEVS